MIVLFGVVAVCMRAALDEDGLIWVGLDVFEVGG